MNKKQIDRLLRLVDFLKTLSPRNFYMGAYRHGVLHKEPKCGTYACVAGWSTLFFPELKRELNIEAISNAWGMKREDVRRVCYYTDPACDPKYSSMKLMKVLTRCASESGYDIVDEE